MATGTIPIHKKKGHTAQIIILTDDLPISNEGPWEIRDGELLGFTLYNILPAGTMRTMLNTVNEHISRENKNKRLIQLKEDIENMLIQRGESFLNDEGVDEVECQDVTRDIIVMVENLLFS